LGVRAIDPICDRCKRLRPEESLMPPPGDLGLECLFALLLLPPAICFLPAPPLLLVAAHFSFACGDRSLLLGLALQLEGERRSAQVGDELGEQPSVRDSRCAADPTPTVSTFRVTWSS